MARFYAGIENERGHSVTRIGHRLISTFVQDNDMRVNVLAWKDLNADKNIFRISLESGRYRNIFCASGKLLEIRDGKIIIPRDFADRIVLQD